MAKRPASNPPTGKTLEFAIPPGTRPGKVVRLKGQGQASPLGGTPGDALVTIEFVAHPLFRPDGDNLRLDLPIHLDQAVLGDKIRVPTLDGEVTMTVPPGANGGRSFRLKGKGLPARRRPHRRPPGDAAHHAAEDARSRTHGADAALARAWQRRRRGKRRGKLGPRRGGPAQPVVDRQA